MTADSYDWNGGTLGNWGTAANWIDTTTGQSSTVPGAANAVTVGAAFSFGTIEITGTGASASLTLEEEVTLAGQFTTGALSLQNDGQLTLAAGATLAVSGDATLGSGGPVAFEGAGSSLSVGGTLSLGGGTFEDTYLDLTGGATVQAATLAVLGSIDLTLDTASSFQVGAAGTVSAGTFKIDNGSTAALSGFLDVPALSLNGVVDAGDLTLSTSTLAGQGTIAIQGSFALPGTYLSNTATGGTGLTLDFAAANAQLQLSAGALDSQGTLEPTIAGFAAGDQIDWYEPFGSLSDVTYSNGQLLLQAGGQTVATLNLAGNFDQQSFAIASSQGESEIVLVGAGDTKTAPSGTAAADSYVWDTSVSGSWDRAANWADTTLGTNPAAVAPGANDTVTIEAIGDNIYTAPTVVISGKGAAGTLDIAGPTLLDGNFTAGALNQEDAAGALFLQAGNRLSVTGMASIGYSDTLSVAGAGASFHAGTLVLDTSIGYGNSPTIAVLDGGALTAAAFQDDLGIDVDIDSASSFAIGAAGTAAAGSMTVDRGATALFSGEIVTPSLVVDGTLDVIAGGLYLNGGAISGTGTIDVAATLLFLEPVSWAGDLTVDLQQGGTLDLSPNALDASGQFGAAIDITPGGVIAWQGAPLTGLAFTAGTLSLIGATGTVATMAVTVPTGSEFFTLLPVYGTDDIVLTGFGDTKAAPAGTSTADTYAFTGTNASWDVAGNWIDDSSGANPALVAPGTSDLVTLAQAFSFGNQPDIVSGKGNAAALAIDGAYVLAGSFAVGSLALTYATIYLEQSDRLAVSGAVSDQTGASVSVAGAGASFSVRGADTIGMPGSGGYADFTASNGGKIQLGGLDSNIDLSLSADQNSSIEIGAAGHVGSGVIAVDAGTSLALFGDITAPTLSVNGTLVANGVVVSANTLAGSGTLEIASSLEIYGSYGPLGGGGLTVAFTGENQTLDLYAAGGFAPTITGFGADDVIVWDGGITGLSYNAGVLTLADGAQSSTLNLAGNFAGLNFIAIDSDYGNDILAVGAGDSATAPTGTKAANSYVWNAGIDGSWDVAANWGDTTKGTGPAALAPGSHDNVSIGPYLGYYPGVQLITGTGSAASLTIGTGIVLDGSFTAGTLTMIQNYFDTPTLYNDASLVVTGNATLETSLTLDPGSSFTTQGTLDFSGNGYAQFSLSGGAYASAAALIDPDYLTLDATSAIAIGQHGHAAAGSFLVTAGATASADDVGAPSLVVNGTLDTGGYASLDINTLGGSGTIAIGGTLYLSSDTAVTITGGASLTLAFDPGGSLVLDPYELTKSGTFQPMLADFATDDSIVWGGTLTSAVDQNGKLILMDGKMGVGTLTLAGNTSGETFLTQTGYGETTITLAATAAASWTYPDAAAGPIIAPEPRADAGRFGLLLDHQASYPNADSAHGWLPVHPA